MVCVSQMFLKRFNSHRKHPNGPGYHGSSNGCALRYGPRIGIASFDCPVEVDVYVDVICDNAEPVTLRMQFLDEDGVARCARSNLVRGVVCGSGNQCMGKIDHAGSI